VTTEDSFAFESLYYFTAFSLNMFKDRISMIAFMRSLLPVRAHGTLFQLAFERKTRSLHFQESP